MSKADTIRLLHAERCSVAEMAIAAACPERNIRWFLENGMKWSKTLGGSFHR